MGGKFKFSAQDRHLEYLFAEEISSKTNGQIISKGNFGLFNSSKKRTKNVCPSRLGQKFKFSSSFFGRIDTNISF